MCKPFKIKVFVFYVLQDPQSLDRNRFYLFHKLPIHNLNYDKLSQSFRFLNVCLKLYRLPSRICVKYIHKGLPAFDKDATGSFDQLVAYIFGTLPKEVHANSCIEKPKSPCFLSQTSQSLSFGK